MDKSFKPFTYFQLLLPMFAAAIVGIGQPVGAIVGGYIVAFSEILLTTNAKKIWNYVAPSDLDVTGNLQLLSTDYKFAVSFIILVWFCLSDRPAFLRKVIYDEWIAFFRSRSGRSKVRIGLAYGLLAWPCCWLVPSSAGTTCSAFCCFALSAQSCRWV